MSSPALSLAVRGVSYATGNHDPDEVRRIMRAIKGELHCTTVMLIDSDLDALCDAARTALEEGLDVWVRPYLPDQRLPALLLHLREAAVRAEGLRQAYPGRVTLLVGSEFSLTSRGVVPGPSSGPVSLPGRRPNSAPLNAAMMTPMSRTLWRRFRACAGVSGRPLPDVRNPVTVGARQPGLALDG